jgi:ribosomal subunit interface protein
MSGGEAMQIQVAGRKIEVGQALRERILASLEERVAKYFDRAGEAFVTVSKPSWAFHVDCSVHLPSGVTLQAHGEGGDPYAALDDLLEKIEKRVRRYKRRLKNHRAREPLPTEGAAERIIELPPDDGDEDGPSGSAGDAPAIIAETDTRIATMTVSMAVLQLELTELPALMFRNASHGGLNMVFRRADGNVGWVDPRVNAAAPAGSE